jgi:flagellar assembly protein FliH
MMEAAIPVKPFGFDRVFHVPGGEPAAVDTHALNDRIVDLQDRITAMAEAHRAELARVRAEGHAAGLAQARGERGVALLTAADAIHAAIEQIDARLAEATDTMMKDAADVAIAAAEVLAGHALDIAPARAIDEALDRVLRQVARGTRLTVRVHPALFDEIQRLIVARAERDRRKLAITAIADETTPEGDALIFWEEGGLVVDKAARRAAVLEELGPLLKV